MAYTPCSCSPCVGCVTVNSCPDNSNCLQLPTMVIPAETSVPCNSSGTVDIGAESNLDACETSINWWVDTWDDIAFENVEIDSNGVLAFDSTNSMVAGQSYKFTGRAACASTLVSGYWQVTLIGKNLCYGINCPDEDTDCNPCTGVCEESDDVEVS
jgi:hypothetical protein